MLVHELTHHMEFQSTPPARGATPFAPRRAAARLISIHAPREGGDVVQGGEDVGA